MTLYLFAAMAFLFPVAIYCLLLALLNAREHPTLVSGPWDFAGALLGASGFLIVGGPLMMAGWHGRWRIHIAHGGRFSDLFGFGSEWGHVWIIAWVVYFVMVLGGSVLMLWRRRRFAVVYNIDPAVLDEVLTVVCGRLQLGMVRTANRIRIGACEKVSVAAGRRGLANGEATGPFESSIGLEVDPFPMMHNVTLAWEEADSPVRRDFEAELVRVLQEVPSPDNPTAGWFLTISSSLFGAIFLGLIAFLLSLFRR